MATAIMDGREYEVRTTLILEKNYGVSVLGEHEATRATVNLNHRKPVLHRYKIHADDAAAATRRALSHMKENGLIDDYRLDPSEEKPAEDDAK